MARLPNDLEKKCRDVVGVLLWSFLERIERNHKNLREVLSVSRPRLEQTACLIPFPILFTSSLKATTFVQSNPLASELFFF